MKKTTKTDQAIVSTIRFSGIEQLRLINEVKELSANCGVVYSDLLRSLIAIGLEAYKQGAIVGFDGRVALSYNSSPTCQKQIVQESPVAESNNEATQDKPVKKSKFLE